MAKTQTELPGAERPTNRELDDLVEKVLIAEETLKDARGEKADAVDALCEAMKEQGVETYVYVDGQSRYHVTRTEAIKVAVKPVKQRRRRAETP